MPTVYRTMKRADDGLPVVGCNAKELGVRVPPNPNADVDIVAGQLVELNGKGMSVVENWRNLLPHLVPKRLAVFFPGATGSNSLTCFRSGNDGFTAGPFSSTLDLVLKAGNRRAGNLVPAATIHVDRFQADLAATRALWSIDET